MAPSDIDPDSFQRLVTLGLVGVEGGAFPLAPMRGKTVLILDAEGDMFHNEALRQGAARVVRHVIGDDRRHFARDGDPFLPRPLRAGSDLPEGRFDIIIFGDAGDISAYGRPIFADLALRLAPGGVLVLECSALPVGESSGFGFASLPIGAQHVVHLDYLVDGLLADFSVRIMGASPVRAGDVLPRYVLRCMPWQSTAILVPGMPLLGKSSIVRQFKRCGYPVFATDQFLAQLLSLSAPVEGSLPARLQALVNVPDPPEFGRFSIIFSEAGLGPELARWMVAALPRDADMFFIEGDLLRHDAIAGPLMTALAALGIRVWSPQREK